MAISGKLVFGIGINDADYRVTRNKRLDGKPKQLWVCPLYRAWRNMLMRCYSEKHQAKTPTYAGCTVTPEWLKFSAFRSWAITQPWEGNEIDKDLLVEGNKVYGPEFCVFVSRKLNCFLTDHAAGRGLWPIGVSRYCNGKKFLAHCNNPNTGHCEYLGTFSSPEQAHEAWRQKKHSHAMNYADAQTDQRIATALRNRYLSKKDSV